MADTPRRIDIGFQGGQVLSVRVSPRGPRRVPQGAVRLRLGRLVRADTRRTPRCTSTSRRSSTCGSTPTSTASASRVAGARRAGPPAAPAAPDAWACAGGRSRADQARAGGRERLPLERDRDRRRHAQRAPPRRLRARHRDRARSRSCSTPLVKYAVRRARPVLEEELPALTPVLSGRSYPSAHASTSFAGARALAAAGLPEPPLHAVATAMALSRPYLGVHYPSDVLAGALLGDAVARLMTP